MDKTPKVCIIGLDGGTFSVLDKWVAAGEMPHLAELMAGGSRAPLISTVPPVTGPAWTSMTTGVNPGQHGIYDFRKWSLNGAPPRLVRSVDCTVPRIWDLAGQAGRQVGVFRVPITYPASAVNGFMVTGLLSPRPCPEMLYPRELYEEIEDSELVWCRLRMAGNGPLDFANRLLDGQRRSRRVLRHVLGRFQPEFFMSVCSELDHAQHILWPYCDRSALCGDGISEAVRTFFRELDDSIGDLRDYFGPGARYFVVSDHGFGPSAPPLNLNTKLSELGFLKYRPARGARARFVRRALMRIRDGLERVGLADPVRAAVRVLSGRVGARLAEAGSSYSTLRAGIDWGQTRAFVRSLTEYGVQINVKGRQRDGIVEPGDEYEQTVGEVMEALQGIRASDCGLKLLARVERGRDLYSGPHAPAAADIIFVPNKDDRLTKTALEHPERNVLSGNHCMDGVLVACGPGIASGQAAEASILDVAPTVLHAAGLPVPRYMEGRVLAGFFDEEHRATCAVRYAEVTLDACRRSPGEVRRDDEGDRIVKERLSDLGYM